MSSSMAPSTSLNAGFSTEVCKSRRPSSNGDAGPAHLLDIEAEVDEVLTRYAAAAGEPGCASRELPAGDEIEPIRRNRNSRSASFTASSAPRTVFPAPSTALYSNEGMRTVAGQA